MRYPDSPEGVAFALLMFIAGVTDPTLPPQRPMSEDEALALYRRCLDATQGDPPSPYREGNRVPH